MIFWFASLVAQAQYHPIRASSFAKDYDNIFDFMVWSGAISFLILMGGMAYFIYKYRRRTDADKTAYITHNHLAEFTWSFVPFVLFMVMFYWGWVVYKDMRSFPDGAYEINVSGQKWAWRVSYKNGTVLVNEMYVPKDVPVVLNMTSEDVIHSFFVPSFRIKQDVVPGKASKLWFRATEEGSFRIFCAEFCGTQHSQMIGFVHVLPKDEFENWEKNQASDAGLTLAQRGEKLYKTQVCFTCHSLDGAKVIGPSFKGLLGRSETLEDGSTVTVDETYIRESILNPLTKIVKGYPPSMPPYQGRITEEQISQIIEFMKTLK